MNVFEELVKWKELFDKGVITQEEFERKKKQLLDLPAAPSLGKCTICGCDNIPTKRVDVRIGGTTQKWVMCDRCADIYRRHTQKAGNVTATRSAAPVRQESHALSPTVKKKPLSRILLKLAVAAVLLLISIGFLTYFVGIDLRFMGTSLTPWNETLYEEEAYETADHSTVPADDLSGNKLWEVLNTSGSQDISYEELYEIYHEYCAQNADGISCELITEFSLLMLRGEWVDTNESFVLSYTADIDCAGKKIYDFLTVSDELSSVKMPDQAYYYYFDADNSGELIIGFEEAASGEGLPNFRVEFLQDSISLYNYADDSTLTAYRRTDADKYTVCSHSGWSMGVCENCGCYASEFLGTIIANKLPGTEVLEDESFNVYYSFCYENPGETITLEYFPDAMFVRATIYSELEIKNASMSLILPARPTYELTYGFNEYTQMAHMPITYLSGQFDANTMDTDEMISYTDYGQWDGKNDLLTDARIVALEQIKAMFEQLDELFVYDYLPDYAVFSMDAWQS